MYFIFYINLISMKHKKLQQINKLNHLNMTIESCGNIINENQVVPLLYSRYRKYIIQLDLKFKIDKLQ